MKIYDELVARGLIAQVTDIYVNNVGFDLRFISPNFFQKNVAR